MKKTAKNVGKAAKREGRPVLVALLIIVGWLLFIAI